jgi:MFS family permease
MGPAGLSAMAQPAFRLYFWGAFARGTALWMQIVALPWSAVELGAGPASVAVIVGLQYLPALVIAPFGGVIADRLRRVRVLQVTQGAVLVLGCVVAGLIASEAGTVAALAVVALVFGVVTAIDLPVRQAFMADLVPESDLSSAASLHSTAWNTSRFIGPGFAGLVIAFVGIAAAFLVSALLLGAVVLSYVRLASRLPHERPRHVETASVLQSVREAMDAVAASPPLRRAFLLGATGHLLGAQVFQSLAPSFVSEVLGFKGGEFGFFMALWGLGAVVASYVATLFADRREQWMVRGSYGIAAGLGLLGLAGVAIIAFPIAGLIGFMQIVLAQNAVVAVQSAAAGRMRGRVLGVYASVLHGVSPAGAVAAGIVGELAGVQVAMVAASIALAAVAWTVSTRSGQSERVAPL